MHSRPGKVHLKTPAGELRAAGILLAEPLPPGRLDLAALFGNARLVEVEVGPGKGTFLLRRAGERPEVNFLGVEWVFSYAGYVADRALRAGLTNVRVLCADAQYVFAACLGDRSIWRVHVYFPDPWPKRKHHRRRLIKAAFLHQVQRTLRPGGWLGIITDHADYFRRMRTALAAMDGFAQVPFTPADASGAMVGTNFEKKYAAAGRPFHALAAMRYR